MDRHAVANGSEPLGLVDDGFWVFMTQQDERDFCHLEKEAVPEVTLC